MDAQSRHWRLCLKDVNALEPDPVHHLRQKKFELTLGGVRDPGRLLLKAAEGWPLINGKERSGCAERCGPSWKGPRWPGTSAGLSMSPCPVVTQLGGGDATRWSASSDASAASAASRQKWNRDDYHNFEALMFGATPPARYATYFQCRNMPAAYPTSADTGADHGSAAMIRDVCPGRLPLR